uniref:uncharacterized protein LOC120887606 n=1 Tax=Ictidomys tridecemlineatus TaxID=43179 RepID=UPI001A9EE30A|nr:uncharacterized protein LOC120887606 [Ictidomys tridecemlineatus]
MRLSQTQAQAPKTSPSQFWSRPQASPRRPRLPRQTLPLVAPNPVLLFGPGSQSPYPGPASDPASSGLFRAPAQSLWPDSARHSGHIWNYPLRLRLSGTPVSTIPPRPRQCPSSFRLRTAARAMMITLWSKHLPIRCGQTEGAIFRRVPFHTSAVRPLSLVMTASFPPNFTVIGALKDLTDTWRRQGHGLDKQVLKDIFTKHCFRPYL